jgi:hypothetical protein
MIPSALAGYFIDLMSRCDPLSTKLKPLMMISKLLFQQRAQGFLQFDSGAASFLESLRLKRQYQELIVQSMVDMVSYVVLALHFRVRDAKEWGALTPDPGRCPRVPR